MDLTQFIICLAASENSKLKEYRNASNKRPGRLLNFLRKRKGEAGGGGGQCGVVYLRGCVTEGNVFLKNSISAKHFLFS